MRRTLTYLALILATIIFTVKYKNSKRLEYFNQINKECIKEVKSNEDWYHEMCNFYGAYEYLNLCNPPNQWIDAYIEFNTYRCVKKKISRKNF